MAAFENEPNPPGSGGGTEVTAILAAATNGAQAQLGLDGGECAPGSVEELLAEHCAHAAR